MPNSTSDLFDPHETIKFVLHRANRRPYYEAERLVRLFELQSWIVSNDIDFRKDAARLLGLCLLEQIEDRLKDKSGSIYLPGARSLFDDDEYRGIYKHAIGRHGGLSALMNARSRDAFDSEYAGFNKSIETACDLIDYRLRYLDHGGTPRANANIAHSQYFILKAPKKSISWGTLSTRWSTHKRKAVFLYVMFRHTPAMQLLPFSEIEFLTKLKAQSDAMEVLQTFFGKVKYVAEVLGEGQFGKEDVIPRRVRPVRPATAPLTEAQLNRMNDYKDNYIHMKS